MHSGLIQSAAWFDLLATAAMVWRSRQLWQSYHAAHASRTQMVNQVLLTGVLGASDLVLFGLGFIF